MNKPPDPTYRTVKVPLKSILHNSASLVHFDTIVKNVQSILTLAYQFNRLYILSKYQRNEQLPKLNKTFCQMVLKVVSSKKDERGQKTKDQHTLKELERFYISDFQPLLPLNYIKPSSHTLSFILPSVAVEMQTSYENNITVHFIKRLRRYIYRTISERYPKPWPKSKEEKKVIKKEIYIRVKSIMDGLWIKDISNVSDDCLELYKLCANKFVSLKPYNKNLGYDLEANSWNYLLPTLNLNAEFERRGWKTFQPLSLRNNSIPKYVPINTPALIYVLDFTKFPRYQTKSAIIDFYKADDKTHKNKNEIWNEHFNLKHRVFNQRQYEFFHRIDTDGVGCSLTFVLPAKRAAVERGSPKSIPSPDIMNLTEESDFILNLLKDRKMIGGDPGKFNLVTLVDDEGNRVNYTSMQRRIESYHKKNGRVIKSMRDAAGVTTLEKTLSNFNSKTMDIEKYKSFVRQKNVIISQTVDFYSQISLRSIRLRGFIYEKRSIDHFLNRIESKFGKEIVIGWGNWSRSSQMKGCIPTPGKGLRKKVSKRFTTYLVDEFNTSKTCYWCKKELKNKSVKGKSIYRCRMCEGCLSHKSDKEILRYVNRDINGALNIRECLKDWITDKSRPRSLQRTETSSTTKEKRENFVQIRPKKDKSKINLRGIKLKSLERNGSIEKLSVL